MKKNGFLRACLRASTASGASFGIHKGCLLDENGPNRADLFANAAPDALLRVNGGAV